MRCPNCGNEVKQQQYVCEVCGTAQITETIERVIPFLKRHEERWRKPFTLAGRFKFMVINPSKAFWDITHKPDKPRGGALIFFASVALYALTGNILYSKVVGPHFPTAHLANFTVYFIFGLLYIGMIWGLTILAQTTVAKYTLNIIPDWGEQGKVISWSFFPSLMGIGIYLLILLLGIPPLGAPGDLSMYSSVFLAGDVVMMIFYFGYVSVLMSIGFREFYDKSTMKAFIGAIIVGVVCAIVFVTTRGTFGVSLFI